MSNRDDEEIIGVIVGVIAAIGLGMLAVNILKRLSKSRCQRCGAPVNLGAPYCDTCGTPL